jgi:hypothetical protein
VVLSPILTEYLTKKSKKSPRAAGYTFGLTVKHGPTRISRNDLMEIKRVHMFPQTSRFDFFKKTSGFYLRYRALLRKRRCLNPQLFRWLSLRLNEERHIARCLKSVKFSKKVFQRIEMIVVDAQSRDKTTFRPKSWAPRCLPEPGKVMATKRIGLCPKLTAIGFFRWTPMRN